MKKLPLLLFVLLLGVCGSLRAQSFDFSRNPAPAMSLDGLWRFHPGDNLAWADPHLDDSQWPLLRSGQDWAEQGYKGMSGYGWYRFSVVLPAGLDDISITLPRFNTSYELYADGSLIGAYGRMPPHIVAYTDCGLSQTYRLPRGLLRNGTAPQQIEIAIRVWLWDVDQRKMGGGPANGGSLIGDSGAVERQHATYFSATLFHYSPGMLVPLLELLAVFGAFFLFLQRRSEREYLWFGILMLARASYDVAILVQDFTVVQQIVIDSTRVSLAFVVAPVAELFFYRQLLKPAREGWFRLALASVLLIVPIAISFAHPLPGLHGTLLHVGIGAFSLPYYLWVLILLFKRARQNVMDARLLLAPALLQKLAQIWNRYGAITYSLGWQHKFGWLTQIITEPVRIDLNQLTNTIFLLAVFAILMRRFTRTRSQEERYASEVHAAREVQQYLIPAHLPATPGLAIESVYRPSREVGGDFFQVLPVEAGGSVLIVVGDVAGKGLQAGMLATLIVGAVRVAASFTCDPAKILALLNERLQGRGLVTCLALRIDRDGSASLANAGHLPPYMNDRELPMEGALPLGAAPGIEFPVMHFKLAESDSLMLMSDGIAEAQDAEGRLFGFDRIGGMLRDKATASALATAAQDFGQEDDITVLTLERTVPA
jgi:hypothetical protein